MDQHHQWDLGDALLDQAGGTLQLAPLMIFHRVEESDRSSPHFLRQNTERILWNGVWAIFYRPNLYSVIPGSIPTQR